MIRYLRMGMGLILFVTGILNGPSASSILPSTFTVTKTADTNDGSCNADCSLREAIRAANASPGTDTITLPAGAYTLALTGIGENAGATGDLDITESLTLNGAGSGSTTINAAHIDRVLDILAGTVTISGVGLFNGNI